MLPVLEESVTQLRPGPSHIDVTLATANDVHLVRARVLAPSVGVTIMNPACVAFLSWMEADGCRINGDVAQPTNLYFQGDRDGFHISGGRRDTIGVAFHRDRLVETLAALRGMGPEDVALDSHVLPLTATVGRMIRPERIVRKAEERYFAAKVGRVSLAGLCEGAGVSQATLYRAFQQVFGESPLAYFRKRKLTKARTALLRARPERGAVKRAALGAGFTELGRFSVEYRSLYGETPSTTLNKIGS
jgi:AraC-like DNA-binding protein